MGDEKRNDNQSLSDSLIAFLLGLLWSAVLGDLWKIIAHQDQAWGDGEILVELAFADVCVRWNDVVPILHQFTPKSLQKLVDESVFSRVSCCSEGL
jgi:hypothetical protein